MDGLNKSPPKDGDKVDGRGSAPLKGAAKVARKPPRAKCEQPDRAPAAAPKCPPGPRFPSGHLKPRRKEKAALKSSRGGSHRKPTAMSKRPKSTPVPKLPQGSRPHPKRNSTLVGAVEAIRSGFTGHGYSRGPTAASRRQDPMVIHASVRNMLFNITGGGDYHF